MTISISPLAKQQFNQNGVPLAGGKLFTYISGSTTKQLTYSDAGGTHNANPIILDPNGQCDLWLDDTILYRYVLSPSTDTDPPTNPFWTEDNIAATNYNTAGLSVLAAPSGASLIGYKSPMAAAVATTLDLWCNNFVNILTFIPAALHADIIAGTSTADVTTYCQNALDSFSALGTSTVGGKIYWTGGLYNVSYLTWAQGVSAVGDGHYTTIVKGNTAGSAGSGFIRMTGISRVAISDVQFDANNKHDITLKFDSTVSTGSMVFSFCDFHGALVDTVKIIDAAGVDDCAHITFFNCYLRSDPVVSLNSQLCNAGANAFHILLINCILSTRNTASYCNVSAIQGMITLQECFFAGSSTTDIDSAGGQVKVYGGRTESTGSFMRSTVAETGLASAMHHIINDVQSAGAYAYFLQIQGTRPVDTTGCNAIGGLLVDTGAVINVGTFQGAADTISGTGTMSHNGQLKASFTPVITFATPGDLAVTYSTQTGSVIKQGNLRIITVNITTSAFTFTTASGALKITGMPEAPSASLPTPMGAISVNGITKAGYTNFALSCASGGWLNISASGSGVAPSNVTAADMPTGGTVTINGTLIYSV